MGGEGPCGRPSWWSLLAVALRGYKVSDYPCNIHNQNVMFLLYEPFSVIALLFLPVTLLKIEDSGKEERVPPQIGSRHRYDT